MKPVVAVEYDAGVMIVWASLECIEDLADLVVDEADAGQV
jgi:hypothetical protein